MAKKIWTTGWNVFSFIWTLVLSFCPCLCYYFLVRVQSIYSPLKKVIQDLWPRPQVLPPSYVGVQLFYYYLVLQSVRSFFLLFNIQYPEVQIMNNGFLCSSNPHPTASRHKLRAKKRLFRPRLRDGSKIAGPITQRDKQ